MSNEVTIFQKQLDQLAPRFEMVLDKRVPVQRLLQTIVVSVERTPKLLECQRQSLFNAAMSAAVLGLEVDGVTGQAFLIPFKDRAQLVIGYKGYNTMAARSGITVTGEVVREGDAFDFDLGEGWIKHKPAPGRGRIIYAWAKAAHNDRPAIVKVLSIDEIMDIKARSPGAKKPDSPWNDAAIGFPAMAEKSAKRRLSRSLPLNVMQYAARMEEAFEEQGQHAWISPDKGVVIEGQYEQTEQPTAEQLLADQRTAQEPTMDEIATAQGWLETAAPKGTAALKEAWTNLPPSLQRQLHRQLENRLKPIAQKADAP